MIYFMNNQHLLIFSQARQKMQTAFSMNWGVWFHAASSICSVSLLTRLSWWVTLYAPKLIVQDDPNWQFLFLKLATKCVPQLTYHAVTPANIGVQIFCYKAQKIRVNEYQEQYFQTQCPKLIFIITIVLVKKKQTKLIYHMSGLYQYPPLSFHRSYKN